MITHVAQLLRHIPANRRVLYSAVGRSAAELWHCIPAGSGKGRRPRAAQKRAFFMNPVYTRLMARHSAPVDGKVLMVARLIEALTPTQQIQLADRLPDGVTDRVLGCADSAAAMWEDLLSGIRASAKGAHFDSLRTASGKDLGETPLTPGPFPPAANE